MSRIYTSTITTNGEHSPVEIPARPGHPVRDTVAIPERLDTVPRSKTNHELAISNLRARAGLAAISFVAAAEYCEDARPYVARRYREDAEALRRAVEMEMESRDSTRAWAGEWLAERIEAAAMQRDWTPSVLLESLCAEYRRKVGP